ncbi:hypothetical protein [Nesterenkonia pannonica]|uniref:hypothetical protein n=1 Tax=Nesterenkonia pannonica TaxID=1548602 RepID=UPI00216412F8|nr:hypothetical protein [Nesterenkonia pannonica]
MALHRANPVASARTVFTRAQVIGLTLTVITVLVCLILWPSITMGALIAAVSVVFLGSTLFKFRVATRGADHDITSFVSAPEPPEIPDEDLPMYTVLVPVYREENIVAQLVRNLGGIDYPQDKLEVFILVEAEDDATRNAVLESNPRPTSTS